MIKTTSRKNWANHDYGEPLNPHPTEWQKYINEIHLEVFGPLSHAIVVYVNAITLYFLVMPCAPIHLSIAKIKFLGNNEETSLKEKKEKRDIS